MHLSEPDQQDDAASLLQDQDPTTEVESSDEGGEYASCDEDQNLKMIMEYAKDC